MIMLSSEATVEMSVLVGVITAVVFLLRRYHARCKTYPPMTIHPFRVFFNEFQRGKNHRFQLKVSRESGLVYRLPFPGILPNEAIVCADSKLARLILEGDDKNEEMDKSWRYRSLRGVTFNVPTMVTKVSRYRGVVPWILIPLSRNETIF